MTAVDARSHDAEGIRASEALVREYVEREIARGVAPGRIVLAGFSQGAAIALQTGLRQAQPLAGLIALSGYLPLAEKLPAERHVASAKVPLLMAHGSDDPVVPIARAIRSRDLLASLGYAVAWHEYPMPHSVCAEEIEVIARFLRERLG